MTWLLLELLSTLLDAITGNGQVRRAHRNATKRGRYIALRESRLAKWVDGEIAVTPTRIDFVWSHSTRSEPYVVVDVAREGAGPHVLDCDTEILNVDTGTGNVRFVVLRRDLDQVLAALQRDG